MSYKMMLGKFRSSKVVHDLRDPLETRKLRAIRYARKNKTEGKRASFA